MKKLFVFAIIVLVAALSLSADVYVKTKTHTDAMSIMGQNTPAKDDVTDQWIGDDKFASIGADQSIIVDLKKNMVYLVNPKAKTYVESPLPFDFAKILPPQAAAMAGMLTMSATVAPTTETKKIGTWNCTGYDVTITIMGMALKMRSWATPDVPFDVNAFNAKFMSVMLKGQMRLDENSVKEFAKIKGFQIASDMSGDIMGAKMRTTSEVLEITKKDAPAAVYTVPAGFTKQATLNLEDLQKR